MPYKIRIMKIDEIKDKVMSSLENAKIIKPSVPASVHCTDL
jgi:hypothetical protein